MTLIVKERTLKINVPLHQDTHGVIRVAGTRIPLENIIIAYNQGETPETIAATYDVLKLSDIYAVIGFYLQNRRDVDDYVQQADKAWDQAKQDIIGRLEAAGKLGRLQTIISKRTPY